MKVIKIILAIIFLLSMVGCWRVNEDLSQDSVFKHMVGKVYKTKMELVVYYYKDTISIFQKKKLAIHEIGTSDFPDREQMKTTFPYRYYDRIICGILPAGSEFKIVKIKQEGSTGMNFTRYKVEITKSTDSQWIGKIINASTLTDLGTNEQPVPQFDPKFAEEIE